MKHLDIKLSSFYEKIKESKKNIKLLDKSSIDEVKSYKIPPTTVLNVASVLMLLLG